MFPEAGSERQRQITVSMIVAMLRGLAIEEMISAQPVDEHFDLFADMVVRYLETGAPEPAAR
ncbi:hypothetical protein KNJ79_18250 [Sphingopyxis indica]|uniref:hypothetical protein n=1 Tax=Sphingopyxis indica TaxID=436663 RepID=UPI00293902C4|nr:hypothetical protein [Sphingopyxis indica]WOF43048.1 hypothetical protein KNJ79_18250 [Sphingopyxis indica]